MRAIVQNAHNAVKQWGIAISNQSSNVQIAILSWMSRIGYGMTRKKYHGDAKLAAVHTHNVKQVVKCSTIDKGRYGK
jgi:hypothetical protein